MTNQLPQPDWQSADGTVSLYCADALALLPQLPSGCVDCVVTDPPYGIAYESNSCNRSDRAGGVSLPGIKGDDDTSLRDAVLRWWNGPALVFGTWKRARPEACRMVLTWEKGNHVGMGDLAIPWKPNTEEVYVIGRGFSGHRGSSVLSYNAPVSWNSVGFGRVHAHQKPDGLMEELVAKCPGETVLDPFMGSGTTGVACVKTGRRFIGVEIDRGYFDIAVKRIQGAFDDQALFADVQPRQVQEGLVFE